MVEDGRRVAVANNPASGRARAQQRRMLAVELDWIVVGDAAAIEADIRRPNIGQVSIIDLKGQVIRQRACAGATYSPRRRSQLAPGRHPLRPVSDRLLLRRRPRCHRHLLAMTNES